MPRAKKVEGHETNEQFVARLMEFSKSGPVTQLFIIESIRRYAEQCKDADPKKLETGIIPGAHWKRCAVEIHEEISKHLGE